MSVEEALAELQGILGKGLHPTAISKVREVLIKVKGSEAQDKQELVQRRYPEEYEKLG
jgi:hypothetical protein